MNAIRNNRAPPVAGLLLAGVIGEEYGEARGVQNIRWLRRRRHGRVQGRRVVLCGETGE